MLRITREMMTREFESRHQLGEILTQINLMKSYATLQGKGLKSSLGTKISKLAYLARYCRDEGRSSSEFKQEDYDSLSSALEMAFDVHAELSEVIKPATPESLEASAPRKGWARITWPRITDILIAVTFVGVALCAAGALLNARFPESHLNELVYLGAALLGAAFSGLYTSYKFICARTFDPASGSSYMTRVVLGAVSGLILANLGSYLFDATTGVKALAPGALALLGGYSADAVNLILTRVADTLVATVRGSGDDALRAKQIHLEAESKATEAKQRQSTVGALTQLLKDTTDPAAKDKIQEIMSALLEGKDLSELQASGATNSDKETPKSNGDAERALEPKSIAAAVRR